MTTIDYAMRVATQLHSEGKVESAKIILNSLLEVYPTHAHALHLSGIIAYQAGNIHLGVQRIQQAIENLCMGQKFKTHLKKFVKNGVTPRFIRGAQGFNFLDPADKPRDDSFGNFLSNAEIEKNSSIALFHSNLGEIYRQAKNIALSIQHGQRAIELEPNLATAWSNLGIAYYDAEQYDQAEECHQRALAINPTLSCSLNNMGSIYKTYGNTKQAIAFYEAAITASPHFVEPLNNLGALLLEQQEFSLALEYFHRAMIAAPTSADIHCNMGLALVGLNRYHEAKLHFEKALQYKPHYAEAYYGIAKIHWRQYHFNEAEHAIRQAIAMNPQQMEFYQLLAEIAHHQGDHAQALAHLNHALAMDSTQPSLYISKGTILMEMGEIAQAEEQFSSISETSSAETRILAHYSLVQLRKTQADSLSLKALLSIANNAQEIFPNKLPYLYFALGKCYDDMGEWAKAFEYFSHGCALKRKHINYKIEEQIQFADKLMHCFTQETIASLRAFANPSSLPIFIVGMPRSGSTLVEQILASHPSVYGAGELTYLNNLIEGQKTPVRYPENIHQLLPENFRDIAHKYLFYLRRISPEAIHITDKMPHNFIAIGLIHALFPNAKIIHIKRNAIDTCLSCYTKLFSEGHHYSYDLTELGQYYTCYERIMNHWRFILPANAWLDVHYEDIIQNLDVEAKRMIAYCDLLWDPACVAFYEAKRQVRTASFMQVRQPVYTSSVNGWRRFEKELAPLVEVLRGYDIL